ncbi:hypothetical protein like AT4G33800 [Hibiscus trionum]|uniref:Uncharacterized protein n=1 Tax=Hibiscus trionum TaxID=183268 RepID=A0A9W7JKL0_HIBTR|nr:hypothetical protein like AT4G33800 [Hibiscus trionum]
MNVSGSQCGSGCESGWTFYLDQSSYSQTWCPKFRGSFDEEDGGKGARFMVESEDLSMVSDASSGPRNNCEDEEDGSFCSDPAARAPAKKRSKNKNKIKEHVSNQHHSCLDDDTASSPAISFSKKNCSKEASLDLLDLSQGFSGTYVKGKPALKKFGFLKSEETGSKDAAGDFLGMTKG